jgi:hypothetical protein
LLGYAKLVTDQDASRHDARPPDKEVQTLVAKEAARIAQIVHAGGYTASWQPFVVAYRKLRQAAETSLPPGDTASGDLKTLGIVARLAQEQGMYRLVRELPVDPSDVANEMLRLVLDWRASRGLTNEASDHALNLFYVCDSTVRAHPWHRLAPAFFHAWDAADKKRDDPQARLIMAMFDGIDKDIKAWVLEHPNADSQTRDRALNEMAKTRGLYSMLET